MRIERLDILRYRALRDVSLPFRRGAKVHLVYGPQEAGKSTALAAIADALYGMPRARLPNAARFDVGELRLGMALATADGERIDFRRRKADRDTLLDADETGHMPDHVLAPYLSGIDRNAFERLHGLTSERLRAAGDELAASGGDANTALFSASAGLAGLSDLTGRIEREADALFGRKKADRRFWQIEREHVAAREREREAQLTATHWTELVKSLARSEAREAEIDAERADLKREIATLEALLRAAPIHARIAALGEEFALYDDLANVPQGFVDKLEALSRADYQAALDESGALEALERLQGRLDQAAVDERLLAAADRVDELASRRSVVAKTVDDLSRRHADLEGHDRTLRKLAGELGVERAELAARTPTAPALAKARDVLRRGLALDTERQTLARSQTQTADEAPFDPAPLRKRFRALGPSLARIASLPTDRVALERDERAAVEAAAQLTPPVRVLSAAARWNLPEPARLSQVGARLDEATSSRDASERDLARLRAEKVTLDEAIAKDAAANIVTRDAILEARRERDAAVSASDLDGARNLIAVADRLADEAFADAETVALAERRRADRATLGERIENGERVLAAVEARHRTADAALRDLFPFVDTGDADVVALSRWTDRVTQLRTDWAEVENRRDALAELQREHDEILPALRAIAEALGIAADALPLDALADLVDETLLDGEAASADRAKDLAVADAHAARARDLEGRWAAWVAECRTVAPTLALSDTASLPELEAALTCWASVAAELEARDAMAERMSKMEGDVALFDADVTAAVRELDPTLAGEPAAAASKALARFCADAAATAEKRRELVEQIEEASEAYALARARSAAAKSAFEEASSAIEGADARAFDETIARLNARDELLRRLAQQREALAGHLVALDPDTIERDLAGLDVAATELRLDRIRADEAALEVEARDIHAEIRSYRLDVSRLEEAGGAEIHAFARNDAAARMAEVGRSWLVLRAARHLLDGAVAHRREAETGPWLARAGALLAQLTDRSFERVELDYSTGSDPRLVGVRPDGEAVATDGMSEGTRDQLYLALRLAHLADGARAMPFIGDDIFMTFDRPRTANGLRTLAALSHEMQPILFTHHDFVVEEAERALGDGLDLIDLSAPLSSPVEDMTVG